MVLIRTFFNSTARLFAAFTLVLFSPAILSAGYVEELAALRQSNLASPDFLTALDYLEVKIQFALFHVPPDMTQEIDAVIAARLREGRNHFEEKPASGFALPKPPQLRSAEAISWILHLHDAVHQVSQRSYSATAADRAEACWRYCEARESFHSAMVKGKIGNGPKGFLEMISSELTRAMSDPLSSGYGLLLEPAEWRELHRLLSEVVALAEVEPPVKVDEHGGWYYSASDEMSVAFHSVSKHLSGCDQLRRTETVNRKAPIELEDLRQKVAVQMRTGFEQMMEEFKQDHQKMLDEFRIIQTQQLLLGEEDAPACIQFPQKVPEK